MILVFSPSLNRLDTDSATSLIASSPLPNSDKAISANFVLAIEALEASDFLDRKRPSAGCMKAMSLVTIDLFSGVLAPVALAANRAPTYSLKILLFNLLSKSSTILPALNFGEEHPQES